MVGLGFAGMVSGFARFVVSRFVVSGFATGVFRGNPSAARLSPRKLSTATESTARRAAISSSAAFFAMESPAITIERVALSVDINVVHTPFTSLGERDGIISNTGPGVFGSTDGFNM